MWALWARSVRPEGAQRPYAVCILRQRGAGGLRARRRVNRPQRGGQGFAFLPVRNIKAVADQMDEASLECRRRENGRHGLAHALRPPVTQ